MVELNTFLKWSLQERFDSKGDTELKGFDICDWN